MATSNNTDSSSEKARGAFDIRGGAKKQRPIKIYVMVGVLVSILIGGFVGIWTLVISEMSSTTSQVDESTVVADPTLDAQKVKDDTMEQLKAEKLKQLEAERQAAEKLKQEQEAKQREQTEPKAPKGTTGNGASRTAGVPPPLSDAAIRKLAGNLLVTATVSDASSYVGASANDEARPRSFSDTSQHRGASEGLGGGLDGGNSSSRGSLNDLSGPTFSPTRAFLSPPGKYLLRHNTYARCVLYTEIITEHPGMVDCRLTDPLYSSDGSTVIAEAGARIDGVQQVEMKAGQATVFTAWTELETTAGVRARLDSLGAGPMGASGTKAWINNHWKDRFGGAMVLTLFKDTLGAVTAKAQSNNDSGYTLNNTEQNVEGMADKALESTINIAPTGHVLPGTVLTIIVARDVDFSSVYENR